MSKMSCDMASSPFGGFTGGVILILVIVVLVQFILAAGVAWQAARVKHKPVVYFIVSFFLTPVVALLLLVSNQLRSQHESSNKSGPAAQ